MFDISSLDYVSAHNSESFPSMGTTPIHGIYAIKNTRTGDFYIGSSEHVARRFVAHKSQLNRNIHHSDLLQNDWNNLGKELFEFIILETLSNDEELTVREAELIATLGPRYNTAECTTNPMKGRKHSLESIAKMKIARTGKGLGPRVFSIEHRKAMSACRIGVPSTHKGMIRSTEARSNISDGAKKSYANGRINGRTRPVEFRGVTYASGNEAANDNNISRANLNYRINKHNEGRWLDAA